MVKEEAHSEGESDRGSVVEVNGYVQRLEETGTIVKVVCSLGSKLLDCARSPVYVPNSLWVLNRSLTLEPA